MLNRPFCLHSPLSPDECAERLRAAADLEDRAHFTYRPVPGSEVRGTVRETRYVLRRGSHAVVSLKMELTADGAGTRLEGRTVLPWWHLAWFLVLVAVVAWMVTVAYFGGASKIVILVVALWVWPAWRDGPALVEFVKRTVEVGSECEVEQPA